MRVITAFWFQVLIFVVLGGCGVRVSHVADTVESDEVEASVNLALASAGDDGVLKVLAIGNSFSEDALEQHLYDLAKAAGVKMVIGNLYIGGAKLELHHNNIKNNAAAYQYRKISEDGSKTNTPSVTIAMAVADENWDYISFQQQSGLSGIYDSFEADLPGLVEKVKGMVTSEETRYILHQTWAYASTSSHGDFPRYDRDQEAMYEAITRAVRKAQAETGIDLVVPAGTAIQNGRNTFLGEIFTRDGYHLSLAMGRYTAAATWFEALTGINVVGNSYSPAELSKTEVAIAQNAAHAAVANPDRVTILKDYQRHDGQQQ